MNIQYKYTVLHNQLVLVLRTLTCGHKIHVFVLLGIESGPLPGFLQKRGPGFNNTLIPAVTPALEDIKHEAIPQ